MIARLALAVLLLTALLAATAGCAARADRFGPRSQGVAKAAPPAPPAPSGPRAVPGERGGFVRLGAGVRVRDDAPPLGDLLAAMRAAEMPAAQPSYGTSEGSYGPEGDTGAETYPTYGDACRTSGYGYGYGYGHGYGFGLGHGFGHGSGHRVAGGGTYSAPGGAVSPGLRAPSDDAPSSGFFAPSQAPAAREDAHPYVSPLSATNGTYR